MDDRSGTITRREAIARLGGAAVGSALAAGMPAQAETKAAPAPRRAKGSSQEKPNILWITSEGIPLEMLGCYGGTLMKTPNIDRIATEGMRFENSFVTNGLCAPSRATLLTGKYSHENGMMSNPYTPPRPGVTQTFDTAP